MFDANPDHEFYVEESYPMDWMYPYLSPFGIIMQVNRKPLELSEEIMQRDHVFWCQYSGRLVGNWITTNTTAKQLCDFVERVYLRHDYTGFTGDPKFIRDEDAQKGFSKLRSAIGASIYEWRANNSRDPLQRKRLRDEAEFAFKQAFAYCPYSEGASHYAQLLAGTGRAEEALLVTQTFQKMDPYNRQGQDMVVQLLWDTGKRAEAVAAAREFLKLEPNNPSLQDLVDKMGSAGKNDGQPATIPLDTIFSRVAAAIRAGHTNEAAAVLDEVMHSPQANGQILTQVAQFFVQMGDLAKAGEAMRKATELEPGSSQTWYNLANVLAFQGRAADAAEALKRALATNAIERIAEPRMINLQENARTNPNFNPIRDTPEFRAALGTN
jgi:tetratricopeptide (TPR) repeat protein